MSDEKPIDPNSDDRSNDFEQTETSRLKRVASGSKDNGPTTLPTAAKPVPKPAPGRTSVVDPMTLRDTHTSKVKRVKAARDSGPLSTVSLPGSGGPLKKTETVQLKVVQQKKKELDQDMNPASTVRLKAPGESSGPSISIPKKRSDAVPRDTLKISLPTLDKKAAEEKVPGTSTVDKRAGGQAEDAPPAVSSASAETASPQEKPKPVKTSTTVLEKVKPKKESEGSADETASSLSAKTSSTVSVPKGGGGRTLKIRGGQSARTVKVKSGGAAKTVQVKDQPPAPDEVKTVKVEGTPPGLKFKSRQQQAVEDTSVPQPVSGAAGSEKAAPGIIYTLGAAASFAALGVTVYFTLTQALKYVF